MKNYTAAAFCLLLLSVSGSFGQDTTQAPPPLSAPPTLGHYQVKASPIVEDILIDQSVPFQLKYTFKFSSMPGGYTIMYTKSPQRYILEIPNAKVTRNISDKSLRALPVKNVEFKTYSAGTEGERLAAIFSVSDSMDTKIDTVDNALSLTFIRYNTVSDIKRYTNWEKMAFYTALPVAIIGIGVAFYIGRSTAEADTVPTASAIPDPPVNDLRIDPRAGH
jgi:hypothetical protein